MVDPQKPDPSLFWCKKCQSHSDYVKKAEVVHEGGGVSYTKRVKRCVICDASGNVPIRCKKSAVDNAKKMGKVALVLNVIIIIWGTFKWGFYEGFLQGIFLCPLASVLLGGLFIWLPYNAAKMDFYIAWKKWAKERGWEDVEEDS